MAPATAPPAPGSMTVPPLFGWEVILVALVVVVAVAVAFVAFGAMRAGRSDRSEWQAWLENRSSAHGGPAVDDDRSPR
jgi:NO-binding membrane sensor protein with MHYT domain